MRSLVLFCLVTLPINPVISGSHAQAVEKNIGDKSGKIDQANSGTLTKVEGDVQIFSNPGKTMQGPAPHALFEGEYYSVRQAKPGDKVENGNIVRNAPKAQAQVIFENGDQIYVGPSTSYRVFWNDPVNAKANSGQTYMRLLYGKVRNVVSKVGPRNTMKIKAGNAVMGVRGTDFYVSKRGASDAFEVSTLRGKVAIEALTTAKALKKDAIIVVSPGYSARIDDALLQKKESVEVKKTSQEELEVIQNLATIRAAVVEDAALQQKIASLETKAVQTTVKDVEHYHPEMTKELKKSEGLTLDAVNRLSVETIAKTAPQEKIKPKPRRNDLELDQDSYQRYFKKVQE